MAFGPREGGNGEQKKSTPIVNECSFSSQKKSPKGAISKVLEK
jgi:hypothetical protein